jgi:hypothetical protein
MSQDFLDHLEIHVQLTEQRPGRGAAQLRGR